MKKSLIALAVLASLAGMASAQSSVTLFGIVDATVAYGKGTVSKKTQLTNSGYNSSRLGFRGTEDLGGGMSASFWLEAGLNNDNGTGAATNTNNQASGGALAGMNGSQGLTFNRRSTVSLAGGWGELRLGRDYTPQFWNLTVFDPFGTNGVGTTQVLNSNSAITGPINVRSSNSIGYFLPGNLGGFYGQVQYYMGENNIRPGYGQGRQRRRPAPRLRQRPVQRGPGCCQHQVRPDRHHRRRQDRQHRRPVGLRHGQADGRIQP